MIQKTVSNYKKLKIFRIGMIFNFLLLPILVLSQDYQQLLVTKDGKNALVNIKQLPITKSLISFELYVKWVDRDLSIIKDPVSQIVFNPKDVIVFSNTSLKIKGNNEYLCFNEKVKISIEYNENDFSEH